MASTVARPTGIPVRRPDVDLANADIDRWIVPGDPILSHVMAALSAVFPNGEDFFVESVRAFRSQIEDNPELKAKVKGFIGQEAMHGREHRAFNERLAALGYPTEEADRNLLTAAHRLQRLPAVVQLSITAASEHFTSVLAHAILSDEATRTTLFPAPDLELLLTWHALEELEHKEVAFDLFDEVSGSYPIRVLGLLLAAVGFGPVVVRSAVGGIVADRRHLTPRALRRNLHHLRRQHMFGLRAGRKLAGYLNPRHHPRHLHTDDLVVEWRDRLAPSMRTAASATAVV
jgi:predicted metal-dependent hydrolase